MENVEKIINTNELSEEHLDNLAWSYADKLFNQRKQEYGQDNITFSITDLENAYKAGFRTK